MVGRRAHKLVAMARGKKGEEEATGLPRLPPGRHGLPREVVVENQRRRIAAGMIAVVVEGGYNAATVTQVVAAAGVSRRTFYNYYSDKQQAFLEVYAEVSGFLLGVMAEAGEREGGGWAKRVRSELDALLEAVAANPDLARFCLGAPPAAGGEVGSAYREFLVRLVGVLGEGRPKKARRPPPASEYGMAGGLAALILRAAEKGNAKALRALLPELTELALAPYLGRDEAARAAG
jgi:AcrR family transcriptional regulator